MAKYVFLYSGGCGAAKVRLPNDASTLASTEAAIEAAYRTGGSARQRILYVKA